MNLGDHPGEPGELPTSDILSLQARRAAGVATKHHLPRHREHLQAGFQWLGVDSIDFGRVFFVLLALDDVGFEKSEVFPHVPRCGQKNYVMIVAGSLSFLMSLHFA